MNLLRWLILACVQTNLILLTEGINSDFGTHFASIKDKHTLQALILQYWDHLDCLSCANLSKILTTLEVPAVQVGRQRLQHNYQLKAVRRHALTNITDLTILSIQMVLRSDYFSVLEIEDLKRILSKLRRGGVMQGIEEVDRDGLEKEIIIKCLKNIRDVTVMPNLFLLHPQHLHLLTVEELQKLISMLEFSSLTYQEKSSLPPRDREKRALVNSILKLSLMHLEDETALRIQLLLHPEYLDLLEIWRLDDIRSKLHISPEFEIGKAEIVDTILHNIVTMIEDVELLKTQLLLHPEYIKLLKVGDLQPILSKLQITEKAVTYAKDKTKAILSKILQNIQDKTVLRTCLLLHPEYMNLVKEKYLLFKLNIKPDAKEPAKKLIFRDILTKTRNKTLLRTQLLMHPEYLEYLAVRDFIALLSNLEIPDPNNLQTPALAEYVISTILNNMQDEAVLRTKIQQHPEYPNLLKAASMPQLAKIAKRPQKAAYVSNMRAIPTKYISAQGSAVANIKTSVPKNTPPLSRKRRSPSVPERNNKKPCLKANAHLPSETSEVFGNLQYEYYPLGVVPQLFGGVYVSRK